MKARRKPKRERDANWTINEKEDLRRICRRYRNVIDCKRTDSEMCLMKSCVWDKIAKEMQDLGYTRGVVRVREAYRRMKKPFQATNKEEGSDEEEEEEGEEEEGENSDSTGGNNGSGEQKQSSSEQDRSVDEKEFLNTLKLKRTTRRKDPEDTPHLVFRKREQTSETDSASETTDEPLNQRKRVKVNKKYDDFVYDCEEDSEDSDDEEIKVKPNTRQNSNRRATSATQAQPMVTLSTLLPFSSDMESQGAIAGAQGGASAAAVTAAAPAQSWTYFPRPMPMIKEEIPSAPPSEGTPSLRSSLSQQHLMPSELLLFQHSNDEERKKEIHDLQVEIYHKRLQLLDMDLEYARLKMEKEFQMVSPSHELNHRSYD